MKLADLIVSAITTFIIVAGGALGVVLASNGWEALNRGAWASAIILGLVAAAKDWRSLNKMPPIDGSGIGIAKAIFVWGMIALWSMALIGCSSFPTQVFRLEQTAVNGAYASYVGYTNGLNSGAIRITPEASNAVKIARLKFAASVGVLESLRSSYETNSLVKPQVQAALDAVLSNSSNLTWTITYWRSLQ